MSLPPTPLMGITARIAAAARAAARAPESITLIAVSKVQPLDRVVAVLKAGHRVFGENYVQEAAGKWPELRKTYPGTKVHMIGPLQTNKAKVALDLFDAIHSVDRPSLAEKLARLAQERGTCTNSCGQVPRSCARRASFSASEGRSSVWMASNRSIASLALLVCKGPIMWTEVPG